MYRSRCVSVYNEQHVIRAKVENMLSMRRNIPKLENLIYVDAAVDGTNSILSKFGDSIRIVASRLRQGKTYGMNLLVHETTADIIVFTNANMIFADDVLFHLLRLFGDPAVGCTLGHLCYVSKIPNGTSATGALYWRLEERIKELESTTGSAITSDGSIFAIRRVLHQPPPPKVTDDIHILLLLLCVGYWVVRVADVLAYEETVSSGVGGFSRKIRIACLAFTAHRMLWPKLRVLPPLNFYEYVAHELLRWVTIYLLGLASIFLVAGLASAAGWVAAVAVMLLDSASLRAVSMSTSDAPGQVGAVLQAFVATGIGVWKSLQGGRFHTWTPPASSRGEMVIMESIDGADFLGAPSEGLPHKF